MAEILKRDGYEVALSSLVAYHNIKMNFKKFLKKYFNYGKGDYDFYNSHKKEWPLKRKLRSIFHVFNRYIVDYPIKAISLKKMQYIPYFWLSALIRYFGWIYSLIDKQNMIRK